MNNKLMNFVEKFFLNLGSKTHLENNILVVTKIPLNFQKFYGRTEPYRFSSEEKFKDDVEFLEKGSYTLKAIKSYLEDSGQTTLLKLDLNADSEQEILKVITTPNAKLTKFNEKKKHNIFFRFTFHTSFQYLNEREKIINEIYIHDGKVIDGNLDDYKVIEGSKREIEIPDMKEPYFIAKEKLKDILKDKTNEVVTSLNDKLENEIKRIERHFETEDSEIHVNLKKAVQKLNSLVNELDYEKVEKQKVILHKLKLKLNPEERLNDKERTVGIEKTKHGLGVDNKLFNTTLIYNKVFTYNTTIKNEQTEAIVELSYNPLTKEVGKSNCNSCAKEITEICLCKNKHIACVDCMRMCESCNSHYCKDCIKISCSKCNKNICKECSTRCSSCGNVMCESHTRIDKISGRVYCDDCLIRCERCSGLKIKESFKHSKKTGAKICGNCFRKEAHNAVMKDLN